MIFIPMEECIFCKFAKKEAETDMIYEDDKFMAFLDISPRNKGHTLVVPKEHFKDIYEMPEDVAKELMGVVKKVAMVIKKIVNPDGLNIVQNNGAAAGQYVFHYHTHLVPRFEGDGDHIFAGPKHSISDEEKAELLKTLRANL